MVSNVDWNAAFTIVLAAAVAWIGWRQHVLDQRRFRLDLFERRFAVYEAVLNQIREALKQASWPEQTDQDFLRQLETARFLFPNQVVDYMSKFRSDLIEFASNSEAAVDTPIDDPARQGFLKLRRDGLQRLREEYPRVAAIFVPHMAIEKGFTR